MTQDMDALKAVVTGGSSGIGLAVARMLTARGAAVEVLDLQPPEGAEPFAHTRCDVGDDASAAAAVAAAASRLGGLDIVVNNAGIGAAGGVADNPLEEWRRVLEINVLGVVRITRAALPFLRQSSAAAIVNTCSVAAVVGLPDRALYSASKGAVQSLTLAMATDLLPEGIRVNGVNPGTADTPWVQRLLSAAADPVAERTALEARQPSGRLITAEEVAAAICYLAGPDSSGTTGSMLAVDGGLLGLRPRPRT